MEPRPIGLRMFSADPREGHAQKQRGGSETDSGCTGVRRAPARMATQRARPLSSFLRPVGTTAAL